VSETYEELGGIATQAKAAPPAVSASRHRWRFVAHFDKATKHRCKNCGATRTRISHYDRFPSTRYTSRAGVLLMQGRVPPCPW
jgi:hypothetical protein